MELETLNNKISIMFDDMNANVIVEQKIVKRFKNNEMSYLDARRYAMDLAMKDAYMTTDPIFGGQ